MLTEDWPGEDTAKGAVYEPGEEASPDTKPEVIPDLGHQLQSHEKMHFCCLGHPSVLFVMATRQTETPLLPHPQG